MKFLTIVFFITISFVSTAQNNTRSEKIITKGETLYLKHIDASITPPAGYTFLEDFSSFLNQQTQTSISVVKDENIPYQVFIDNMLKRDYEVGNAKLLSHKKLEEGYLFTFLFTINNAPVERIIYIFGNKKFTIWATANYRQLEKDKHFETLKNCLLSIKY